MKNNKRFKLTLREMYDCMDNDSKDTLMDYIRENKDTSKLYKKLSKKYHKVNPDYSDWINVFDKYIEYGIDLY